MQKTFQGECFAPRKVLQRSPPSKERSLFLASAGKENCERHNGHPHTTQMKTTYQDECFTPRKKLQRSPPSRARWLPPPATNTGKEHCEKSTTTVGPGHQDQRQVPRLKLKKNVFTENRAPSRGKQSANTAKTIPEGNGPVCERKVQDSCFTPKKSLKRSPPNSVKYTVEESQLDSAMPPVSHWEIPRTPVMGKTSASVQNNNELLPHTQVRPPTTTLGETDAPPTAHRELPHNETDAPSYSKLSHRTIYKETDVPPTFHRELPRTPTNILHTSPKELPHTPIHRETEVPPTSHREPQCTLIHRETDLPPTSHKELPRTPIHRETDIPPTSHKELPRTPIHRETNVPPTSHKELQRTPIHRETDVPPTSHKELQRTPIHRETDVPPTSHRELQRTPIHRETDVPPTSHRELPHTPIQRETEVPPTSHRELQRTPIHRETEVPPTSHKELPRTPIHRETDVPPASHKELPRTPIHRETDVPPASHKELPRTPIHRETDIPPASRKKLLHTPIQKMFSHEYGNRELYQLDSRINGAASPTRTRSPRHPLSFSNRALPLKSNNSLLIPATGQKPLESYDVSNLPGMRCTDNDLAFLQRMENMKQYKILKMQTEQLTKEFKTVTEEREQLEHTALKVQRDLDAMKAKYQETVSTMNALISDPGLLLIRDDVSHKEDGGVCVSPSELSHADMAQLKKMNQLTSALLEKTNRDLVEKMVEMDATKRKLQEEIMRTEAEDKLKRADIQTRLQDSENKKILLEKEIEKLAREELSTKAEMDALLSHLARLELSKSVTRKSPEQDTVTLQEGPAAASSQLETRTRADDKKRAEERLKRIVERCNLNIQRHQMLKEMGLRPRKHRQMV